MINLDDLCLNEIDGPLGTGAFGAVYRGIWKVRQNDYGNLPNLENVLETNSKDTWIHDSKFFNNSHGISLLTNNHPDGTVNCQSSVQTNDNVKTNEYKYFCVAVKILNEVRGSSDLQALLDEAKVMASVSHHHCLPLLGICLSQTRKCLVSAYVVNGSLDRYLRIHAPDLDSSLMLNWAAQIADGMVYLQSRGIIHRDLATRNVLVRSHNHLQITDFGLAKMLNGDDEEKGNEVIVCSGRVPIRWLACETLTNRIYSFKTDVWAYGVTIWEIFTFGDKPYDRIETANVKDHVLAGGRLPQPDLCTLELYQVMLNCWNENSDARPNFLELYDMFKEFTCQPRLYLHSRAGSSLNTTELYSSTGGDTRSRTTIYPPNPLFGDRFNQNHPITLFKTPNSNSPSGTGSSNLSRKFDTRNRMRNSLWVMPGSIQASHRLAKMHQQKRRSIGGASGRTEHTMSTSISMNSGISDRWSHSSFTTHSHPVLLEVNEINEVGNDTGMFSANSWASSGHPLLSSDQDSSMSQLMLTNFGYTSSDSHQSINNHSNGQIRHPRQEIGQPLDTSLPIQELVANEVDNDAKTNESTVTTHLSQTDSLPNEIELTSNSHFHTPYEVAAGYIWPQWPIELPNSHLSTTNNNTTLDNSNIEFTDPANNSLMSIHSENDGNFPSLNRQLWLRRNARQRLYYTRQMQQHRSALNSAEMQQTQENLGGGMMMINENDILNAIQEDSDTDQGSIDRYCLDPTIPVESNIRTDHNN